MGDSLTFYPTATATVTPNTGSGADLLENALANKDSRSVAEQLIKCDEENAAGKSARMDSLCKRLSSVDVSPLFLAKVMGKIVQLKKSEYKFNDREKAYNAEVDGCKLAARVLFSIAKLNEAKVASVRSNYLSHAIYRSVTPRDDQNAGLAAAFINQEIKHMENEEAKKNVKPAVKTPADPSLPTLPPSIK